jgi:hypothetical protein
MDDHGLAAQSGNTASKSIDINLIGQIMPAWEIVKII